MACCLTMVAIDEQYSSALALKFKVDYFLILMRMRIHKFDTAVRVKRMTLFVQWQERARLSVSGGGNEPRAQEQI